jgi:hypothetical protein
MILRLVKAGGWNFICSLHKSIILERSTMKRKLLFVLLVTLFVTSLAACTESLSTGEIAKSDFPEDVEVQPSGYKVGQQINDGERDWIVIGVDDKGRALVITEEVIEEKAFDEGGHASGVSNEGNNPWYTNIWADCTLYQYLNDTFIDRIGQPVREKIANVNGDNVFLLSKDEYYEHWENIPSVGADWWWLRTPSSYHYVYNVTGDYYEVGSYGVYYESGIRLALWLDL